MPASASALERLEVVDVQRVAPGTCASSGALARVIDGSATTIAAVDRVGQRLAVAVEDVAAHRGQLDGDGAALGGRQRRVVVGAHALQLDQPRAEEATAPAR